MNGQVVSRQQWLEARRALLAQEKEFTRQRDALSAQRRELPMVAVDEDYVFDGPDGPTSLLELFGEQPQLIVYHLNATCAAASPSTLITRPRWVTRWQSVHRQTSRRNACTGEPRPGSHSL